MKRFFLPLLSLLLFSCEEEIGKLDLTQETTQEISFHLEKDREVQIWTNIDIEYKELPLFVFDFEFYKESEFIISGGTDPLTSFRKTKEIKETKNGITHWKFYGKVDGNFIPKEDANYTFKTTFVKNNKTNLKINKVEVVFIK